MFASIQTWRMPTPGWRRLAIMCMVVLALPLAVIGATFMTSPVAHASSSLPSWWTGNCDSEKGTLITTDASLGVQICYPNSWNGQPSGQPNYPEQTAHGVAKLAEWQCVEFSSRYLEQVKQMPNKGGVNGKDVASAYYSWYSGSMPGLSLIYGGTTHTFPSVGDVLSTTSGEDPSTGHTGVINYVHIDNASAGDGYVMMAQENTAGGDTGWTPDGTGTNTGWGDNSFPYTKLLVTNWSYYDGDFSNPPTENDVQILHFGSSAPTNPTYNSHEVYVVGTNHHLYQYQYTSSANWVETDISASSNSTGTALAGAPSGDFSANVHFVYAVGSDGHLYEFYPNSSGVWSIHDLSSFAGGATFQGSPDAYSFSDPSTATLHHVVNVITSSGHFAQFDYTSSSNWTYGDVSGTTTAFSGAMSGLAVVGASSYSQLVFGSGSDGKLYEYAQNGGSWIKQNAFTLASGVSAVRAPSAYAFVGSNGTTDYSVFVEGGNGNLYNLRYTSSTNWQTTNVSSASGVGSLSLTGSPSGHISYQGSTLHFVYVTDANGDLDEFVSTDGSGTWTHYGLGTSGGTGVALTGSPWAYSFLGTGATNTTHIVFFTENDGRLHEKAYTTSWTDVDLGAPSGVSFSGSSPNAYGYSS